MVRIIWRPAQAVTVTRADVLWDALRRMRAARVTLDECGLTELGNRLGDLIRDVASERAREIRKED
jgi:hypothetical protein